MPPIAFVFNKHDKDALKQLIAKQYASSVSLPKIAANSCRAHVVYGEEEIGPATEDAGTWSVTDGEAISYRRNHESDDGYPGDPNSAVGEADLEPVVEDNGTTQVTKRIRNCYDTALPADKPFLAIQDIFGDLWGIPIVSGTRPRMLMLASETAGRDFATGEMTLGDVSPLYTPSDILVADLTPPDWMPTQAYNTSLLDISPNGQVVEVWQDHRGTWYMSPRFDHWDGLTGTDIYTLPPYFTCAADYTYTSIGIDLNYNFNVTGSGSPQSDCFATINASDNLEIVKEGRYRVHFECYYEARSWPANTDAWMHFWHTIYSGSSQIGSFWFKDAAASFFSELVSDTMFRRQGWGSWTRIMDFGTVPADIQLNVKAYWPTDAETKYGVKLTVEPMYHLKG